eukprot:7134760-Ditylum_brightwellii.AAC.1
MRGDIFAVGDFGFGGGDFDFGSGGDFDVGSGRDFDFDGEEDVLLLLCWDISLQRRDGSC